MPLAKENCQLKNHEKEATSVGISPNLAVKATKVNQIATL